MTARKPRVIPERDDPQAPRAGRLLQVNKISESEWLAWRRNGIGGSDAPTLMGLNDRKGPLALYVEKIGSDLDDSASTQHESAYWGRVLEDVVAREFATRTGLQVVKPSTVVQHPRFPWMLGTVDRYVLDGGRRAGLLECKTTSVRREHLWDEGVPEYVNIQVQHYLAVTELPRAWVAVLIGGQKFRSFDVPRDEPLIARLIEVESEFWRRVQEGDPPPVDGLEATTAILNAKYPVSVREEVELPESLVNLAHRYDELRRSAGFHENELSVIAQKLKVALGSAEHGTHRGRILVSWRTHEVKSLDTRKLKAELPEVAAEYTRVKRQRPFRVYPTGIPAGQLEQLPSADDDPPGYATADDWADPE